MRILSVILLVLLLVPGWSGDERLPLYDGTPRVRVARVAIDAEDPRRTTAGALTYLGGVHFSSGDPAFGGYSALTVRGDRFLLLSDGGLSFGFTMGRNLRPRDYRFGAVPDGPGTGWRKAERDSESLVADPATGNLWVGFERANAIWLYTRDVGRAVRWRAPAEMRDWPDNGGAEAMARLPGGQFLILSEEAKMPGGGRQALLFDTDPTDPKARSLPFRIVPPAGYSPTDAVALPDGRLLILVRALSLGDGFTAKLLIADWRAIRRGAALPTRDLATFAYPLLHDNFEGLAVSRDGDATIVWLLSDDNGPSLFQRTLLLKFRLEAGHAERRPDGAVGTAFGNFRRKRTEG